MAIVTVGLTKEYKSTTAVNRLDLHVAKGSVYGFLGPNGAGKTTTIRMLLGLVEPTAGTAKILGHDIKQERNKIVQKIGAIVETPAFYNYLSAEDNLKVFAYSANSPLNKKRMEELIELVGLKGRSKDKVKTYSLGMKQRLGIAITLINNPQVLFLDEPTNGLDPAGTVEMRHLIEQLQQEDRTIFISSHLLNEVELMCTHVAIVKKGEKKLEGEVKNLLGKSNTFTIQVSPTDQALTVLQSYPDLKAQLGETGWLKVTAEAADIPNLVFALAAAKINIYQIVAQRNTLEDLFLQLTT